MRSLRNRNSLVLTVVVPDQSAAFLLIRNRTVFANLYGSRGHCEAAACCGSDFTDWVLSNLSDLKTFCWPRWGVTTFWESTEGGSFLGAGWMIPFTRSNVSELWACFLRELKIRAPARGSLSLFALAQWRPTQRSFLYQLDTDCSQQWIHILFCCCRDCCSQECAKCNYSNCQGDESFRDSLSVSSQRKR